MKEIFIPGNVPSSKNSKQWTGKMLIHSKPTRNYIRDTKQHYIQAKKEFKSQVIDKAGIELSYPIHIDFYFVRNSRRKFDYINPAQTVQDLMVKYNWIEDDNATFLLPVFEPYEYNKVKPGVLITIKSNKHDNEKE